MPYLNERATGDSLWRIEENPSVQAFKGCHSHPQRPGNI